MKKLSVAEKPSVGRDIARVLGVKNRGEGYLYGDDYVVTWAIGHLVTLMEPGEMNEAWKKWRMEDLPMLPESIPLKVLPETAAQFKVVSTLMNSPKIASIICATDSAREGELIFRYIYAKAGCRKAVERLWISSMTDAAIRQGFAQLKPSGAYDALYESARCRSEADWLVGMNASRAFSLVYDAHLSIGRVQTPTLALIVARDKEIAEFVPKDYWELTAGFGDYEGLWLNPAAKAEEEGDRKASETRIPDKALAEKVAREVRGQPAVVLESATNRKRFQPPQLFDLTELQREANKKKGFSADKTLKLAQSLYEKHKLLTYPRTDSRYLPEDMKPKIAAALGRLPEPWQALVQAPEFRSGVSSRRFYDDSKISDHHAIVPTDRTPNLSALTDDERALYDMVVRRVIAMHYPDYVCDQAKVITGVGEHRFRSTGSMPVEEGWHRVYGGEKDPKEEKPLPALRQGDVRRVEKTRVQAHRTKPPAAHNDASLLNLMENAGRLIEDEALREQMKSSGLGTPATRAATIERLIQMGYARRSGKSIVSTEKGRQLIAVVPVQISSAVTTGKWEKFLSEMAGYADEEARTARSRRFMDGIGRFSQFLVEAARNAPRQVHFEKETFRPKAKRAARPAGKTTARKKKKSSEE